MQNADDPKELPSLLTKRLEQERRLLHNRLANIIQETMSDCNMLTLINTKLPPEILSAVFHHTKNGCRAGYMSNIQWVRCVSHVCRRWRSIALSDPSLWTEGFPMNAEAVQMFLKRSKNLPIVIDKKIASKMLPLPQFQHLILSFMERARALYVDVPNTSKDISIILKALQINMPRLEILDLSFSEPWPRWATTLPTPAGSDIPIPKPENLKHVQILKLRGCWFDWDRVEARNLTMLCLCDLPPGSGSSLEQIFRILKHSPGLQNLHLTKVARDETPSSSPSVPLVDFSLSQLKCLELVETGSFIVRALVNPAVLWGLERVTLEFATDNKHVLKETLLSATNLLKQKSVSIIRARSYDHFRRRFFSCSLNSDSDNGRRSSLSFSSSWEKSDDLEMDLPQILFSCMKLINLGGLLKLDCSLDRKLSEQWWRDVLGLAHSLEVLRIEDWSLRDLIFALRPRVAGDSRGKADVAQSKAGISRERSAFLSPSLAKLTMLHVRNPVHRRSSSGQLLRQLADCMESRNSCGAELITLAISHTSSAQEFECMP